MHDRRNVHFEVQFQGLKKFFLRTHAVMRPQVAHPCYQWCKSLLSIGGIICNFTPILPYFQHWGDGPRPKLFSGEQIKTKRKGLHLKWNIFSPNLGGDLRSDAHQRQIIGGDADEDHT